MIEHDDQQKLKKRGGRMFPRLALDKACGYSQRIVEAFGLEPQKPRVLFPVAFGARSWLAQQRSAALRQYGLLEGTEEDGLFATPLAKEIAIPDGEQEDSEARTQECLIQACLSPTVFREVFQEITGKKEIRTEEISKSIQALGVHPENAQACLKYFLGSLEYAGLAEIEDEYVRMIREATLHALRRNNDNRWPERVPSIERMREELAQYIGDDENAKVMVEEMAEGEFLRYFIIMEQTRKRTRARENMRSA